LPPGVLKRGVSVGVLNRYPLAVRVRSLPLVVQLVPQLWADVVANRAGERPDRLRPP
jgi:hypothetical protein